MADSLKISGCEKLTAKLLGYFQEFILRAFSNDSGRAMDIAQKICYDCENLKGFIPDGLCPAWLNDSIVQCGEMAQQKGKGISAENFGKRALAINQIFIEVKDFSWAQWLSQRDCVDLDKEFAKEAAARHLDDAIDRLIECLNIISNDPEFNLGKQTTVDIQTLVGNLENSKKSSQSAIRSWLYTAGELVKLFVPHLDKIEKGIELIKKTKAAYNEACEIIDGSSHAVALSLGNKFCFGGRIITQGDETPRLSLPSDLEDGDQK